MTARPVADGRAASRKLQLRREVTANTNKIESYNGFGKWFSFGGDVIPENDPVEQQKRLRYNDLVAACVILQNTVDMMKTLEDLTAEGQGIDMTDVRFLSPYATGHVKRFGDCALDLGKPPESWLSEVTFSRGVESITTAVRSESDHEPSREIRCTSISWIGFTLGCSWLTI
jgi:hypothetical protein